MSAARHAPARCVAGARHDDGFDDVVARRCVEPSVTPVAPGLPLLVLLVFLAIAVVSIWSSIAVGVKRLHDIDKSGWWMLLIFVPIVGAIALFVRHGNRCMRCRRPATPSVGRSE